VVAGIVVHTVFAATGLIPQQAKDIARLASFRIDYTFFLNLFALLVAALLVHVGRRAKEDEEAQANAREAA